MCDSFLSIGPEAESLCHRKCSSSAYQISANSSPLEFMVVQGGLIGKDLQSCEERANPVTIQ